MEGGRRLRDAGGRLLALGAYPPAGPGGSVERRPCGRRHATSSAQTHYFGAAKRLPQHLSLAVRRADGLRRARIDSSTRCTTRGACGHLRSRGTLGCIDATRSRPSGVGRIAAGRGGPGPDLCHRSQGYLAHPCHRAAHPRWPRESAAGGRRGRPVTRRRRCGTPRATMVAARVRTLLIVEVPGAARLVALAEADRQLRLPRADVSVRPQGLWLPVPA